MAESMSFQQICSGERLGANLTLIRLFLGVHANMTAEVVKSGITLRTSTTAVQSLSTQSFSDLSTGGHITTVIGGRPIVSHRPRAFMRWFTNALISAVRLRLGGQTTRRWIRDVHFDISIRLDTCGPPSDQGARVDEEAVEPVWHLIFTTI